MSNAVYNCDVTAMWLQFHH